MFTEVSVELVKDRMESIIPEAPDEYPLTNFICMQALEQAANPEMRCGVYSLNQLRNLLHTAMARFAGARLAVQPQEIGTHRLKSWPELIINTGLWDARLIFYIGPEEKYPVKYKISEQIQAGINIFYELWDSTKIIDEDGNVVPDLFLSELEQKLNDPKFYWRNNNNACFGFYDLTSNDALEFKKKHRILKVGTVDGSIKTVLVDQSLPIQQLVEIVCEKIRIQNPEEYSFLPDTTHTSHASKSSPKRKGIYDNEDGEQGIKDSEIVILKKKFFFSDQNIDRNDPIQLNLMYNHSKEMIVSGKHPCKLEEAILFASLQCQFIFGNHEPDNHKPGSLKLSDFVPSEYLKKKELEKKIFSEHRKLQGLSELNAKFRYVQLSRSLKTYGITFFQVKERVPKKSKLVTVLLGVTKQSLVKLEVETKEILVEWKLTTLRRWAASPTSVQTNEGEAISQLIAGYIDIILKKRKEASKTALIIEDEQATVEEYVKPGKATNIGVVSSGQKQAVETKISTPAMMLEGNRPGYSRGVSQGIPQFGNYKSNGAEMSGAQQALLQNISNCLASMRATANDLNVPMHLPPMGDDAASRQWKQQTSELPAENIASQISAHLAAIGSLINETIGEPEDFDSEAIAASVATLSSNLSQLSQASKMLAALSETRAGDKLLEAARELAKITATVLDKFVPVIIGEGTNGRQEVFGIARDFAMASSELLSRISKLDIPSNRQSEIVDAAKAVARAVAELVANSKNVANATQEQEAQQQILMDGKNCNEALRT
ncbi:Talin-1 [Nowakowskiella sp. JEL0407]|nr:Talin-1 [Nowakowskiella sp. JEL0407]